MKQWLVRLNHGGFRAPWFTFILAALAIAFYFFAGAASTAWVFDRTAIADGQWWRLITGHLVHSDGEQVIGDVSALIVIGWMLERNHPLTFIYGIMAGTVAVNLWLWFGMPELERYCGLSGTLHAVLLLLIASLWRETRQPLVMVMAALIVGKVFLELWTNQALITETAWPSVPIVHVAGLCGGVILLFAQKANSKQSKILLQHSVR